MYIILLATLLLSSTLSNATSLNFAPLSKLEQESIEFKFQELKLRSAVSYWDDLPEGIEAIDVLKSFFEQAQELNYTPGILWGELEAIEQSPNKTQEQREENLKRIMFIRDDVLKIESRFLHARYWLIFSNLGEGFNNYEIQIARLEKAQAFYQEDRDNVEVLVINAQLINILNLMGENEKALVLADWNERLIKIHEIALHKAQNHYQFGYIHSSMGEYAKSNDRLYKALEIHRRRDDIGRQVEVLNMIAFNKLSLENYQGAIDLYLQVEKFFAGGQVSPSLQSYIYANLAASYNRLEMVDESVDALNKAIKVDEAKQLYSNLISNKSNLAIQIGMAGRYKEALGLIKEVEAIDSFYWKPASQSIYLAAAMNTYRGLKDFEKAITFFEKALKVDRESGDKYYLRFSYRQGVGLYEEAGDFKKALKYQKLYHNIRLEEAKEKNKKLLYAKENEFLEKENQLKDIGLAQKKKEAQQLKVFASILILLLLALIALLRNLSIKSRIIRESKRQMDLILENIDEGICVVQPDLSIQKEYSKNLPQFLPDPHNFSLEHFFENVVGFSELSTELKKMLFDSVKVSFGAEIFQWEVNVENLPNELVIDKGRGKSYYFLKWKPIVSSKNIVKGVLLSIHDVTESRELEKRVSQQQERMERISHIIIEMVSRDRDQSIKLIHNTLSLLNSEDFQSQLNEGGEDILKELHSIKGMARHLGLSTISNLVHEFEGQLQNDGQDIQGTTNRLRAELVEYQGVVDQFLGDSSQKQIQSFSLPRFVSGQVSDLNSRLRKDGLGLKRIHILDEVVQWPIDKVKVVQDILIHGLNNAVDHGFISPAKKGKLDIEASLELKASITSSGIEIKLRDNGVGLDEADIRSRAEVKGLDVSTVKDFSEILFMDGFSSQDSISLSSGRGVGLSAVASIAKRQGGGVRIYNADSGGACLEVWI